MHTSWIRRSKAALPSTGAIAYDTQILSFRDGSVSIWTLAGRCFGRPSGGLNRSYKAPGLRPIVVDCLLYDEVVANFPRAWRNGRRSGLKQS
jgi:hypothetical protein